MSAIPEIKKKKPQYINMALYKTFSQQAFTLTVYSISSHM